MAACSSRTPEPGGRAVTGGAACCEAGRDEIAACRRFPVGHFASDENAGKLFQHPVLVNLIKRNAACNADCFVNGTRADEWQGEMFDRMGKLKRIVENLRRGKLAEKGGFHAVNARLLAEMVCERGAPTRCRESAFKSREIAVWREVQFGRRFSISFQHIAQRGGKSIDEASLYAV